MAWSVPEYDKEEVDSAGLDLINPRIDPDSRSIAVQIVNNWRSAHYFPLNTMQISLRNKACEVDPRRLVAQRIKRLSAIEDKLKRFSGLPLSEIQDIGGCRAVVAKVPGVRKIVSKFKKSSHRHELIDEDDYIHSPKKSGYRCYHLIYRYTSDHVPTYNGLKIEIQIRSRLQHIWATAVETVGNFTRQALKSSSGQADWLRFFALMGSVIANIERQPVVPNTPTNPTELKEELQQYVDKLGVITRLTAFGATTDIINSSKEKGGHYTLIVLDTNRRRIEISQYSSSQLELGFEQFSKIESTISGKAGLDAVLVSTESFRRLRRAYPNYFLDTREFLDLVKKTI